MKRKLDEVESRYDDVQKRLECLTLRDAADGIAGYPAAQMHSDLESPRETKAEEIKMPRRMFPYSQGAQPAASSVRSRNVPFEEEGSTDGDESGEDDVQASGYDSAEDDVDLSALAGLSIRDFEVHQFLQVDPDGILPDTDMLFDDSLVSVTGAGAWKRIRMSRASGVNPKHFWRYDTNTAIWIPYKDLSRCVFLHPALRCDPVKREPRPLRGGRSRKMPSVGLTRDLCYSVNGSLYYCGTYRCVGVSVLKFEELCKMGGNRTNALLDRLVHRTMTVPSVRPRINMDGASITRTIRELYEDGTLRIYCAGVQLVGYNNKVKESFLRCSSTPAKKRKGAKKKGGKGEKHDDELPMPRKEMKRPRRS